MVFSPSHKSVIFCDFDHCVQTCRLSNRYVHIFQSTHHRKIIFGYLETRKCQDFIGSKIFACISINLETLFVELFDRDLENFASFSAIILWRFSAVASLSIFEVSSDTWYFEWSSWGGD